MMKEQVFLLLFLFFEMNAEGFLMRLACRSGLSEP